HLDLGRLLRGLAGDRGRRIRRLQLWIRHRIPPPLAAPARRDHVHRGRHRCRIRRGHPVLLPRTPPEPARARWSDSRSGPRGSGNADRIQPLRQRPGGDDLDVLQPAGGDRRGRRLGHEADARPLADGSSLRGRMYYKGSEFYSISAHSDEDQQAAAMRFVDFMVNDPEALELAGMIMGVPPNTDAVEQASSDLGEMDQHVLDFVTDLADDLTVESPGPSPIGSGNIQGIFDRETL